MIVILNTGADLLLYQTYGLDTGYSTGMELHLYGNDYTPVPTSVPGDFTELTFTGWSPVTLDQGLWSYPTISSDHPYMWYNLPSSITVTNSGVSPVTVYGYYVNNNDIGNYLFAERLDSPRTLAPGQSFNIILALSGGNCSIPPPPPPPP